MSSNVGGRSADGTYGENGYTKPDTTESYANLRKNICTVVPLGGLVGTVREDQLRAAISLSHAYAQCSKMFQGLEGNSFRGARQPHNVTTSGFPVGPNAYNMLLVGRRFQGSAHA